MSEVAGGPPPLASLLSVYAGPDAERHRLLWTLDDRLAQLVATTSEPMIGQIRLAWWHEALTDASGIKGKGEPLIDAMRERRMTPPAGLAEWLDGWEAMLGEIDLEGFATGRGGGLFRALAGQRDVPDWLVDAGAIWALWDLSGHTREGGLAEKALTYARQRLLRDDPVWPREWRPMRIAYALARHDVIRGRRAPERLTPRLYLRLIRMALTGR